MSTHQLYFKNFFIAFFVAAIVNLACTSVIIDPNLIESRFDQFTGFIWTWIFYKTTFFNASLFSILSFGAILSILLSDDNLIEISESMGYFFIQFILITVLLLSISLLKGLSHNYIASVTVSVIPIYMLLIAITLFLVAKFKNLRKNRFA